MTRFKKAVNDYYLILFFPILFLITAFVTTDVSDIMSGMKEIILARDVLLMDYLEVSNLGATMFNASIVSIIAILLMIATGRELDGMSIASILTILGFAFIGKNVLNVLPIYLGGYLFSKVTKEPMKNFVIVIIFGTTLAPFVTEVAFYYGLNLRISIILSILAGAAVGFLLTLVSRQVVNFHEGYNLYNIGFTGGIIGTVIASILRGFGVVMDTQFVVSTRYSNFFMIYLTVIFLLFIVYSMAKDKDVIKKYKELLKETGKSCKDFQAKYGNEAMIFNMGVMGLASLAYVVLSKGTIDGSIVAAVITVVGFAATGKHLLNSLPVMLGVFIVAHLGNFDASGPSAIMAGLFGTTIAPIAGEYGFLAGVVAGGLHILVGANILPIHGGLNLYNNGFAGGFVAGVMHAICKNIRIVRSKRNYRKIEEAKK